MNERITQTVPSLYHIIIPSKLISLLTSAILFYSPHIFILGRLSVSHSVALFWPLVLKLQIDPYSVPNLWNSLIRSTSPCSSSLSFTYIKLNSPVSDLSTSLFLKNERPISFTLLFFLSLYSPRLSLDWYIRYWPSFVDSYHPHFAIIHRHFIHANSSRLVSMII